MRTWLVLVLATLPLSAQTPTVCGAPSGGAVLLQMQADVGNGPQWYCPTKADNLTVSNTRFRITAPKGSWCTLVPRAYISGSSTTADQLRATYPWLDFIASTDPQSIVPGAAPTPMVTVDPGLLWFFIWNGLVSPVTGSLSNEAVRDLFVPILEDPSNPASAYNQRAWDAQPDGWMADPNGTGIGLHMAGLWSGVLTDPSPGSDSGEFSMEGLTRTCCLLQAPSADAANQFLSSPDFLQALIEGMSVELQVVCMTSATSVTPGTSDLNAPTLGIPNMPAVNFSNSIVVGSGVVSPLTGSGGQFQFVQAGTSLDFVAQGVIPRPTGPAVAIFGDHGGNPLAAVPVLARGTLRAPFRHQTTPPLGVGSNSTVSVTFGVVPGPGPVTTPVATVTLFSIGSVLP